ncbi:migration and invasion-inhibitory protein isoform X2 [Ictalurus furcatus]|uniref:migration and invasion-inhibitory protein isoform X2 n=1 Tax=Ictalurus furcatus TaxID=66913 RepID=UPI0023506737|nr:migration and invasion-inhibitory protein isoform X2 [Ictalurus furcatus]
MSSFEHLDALRRRNKELLQKLNRKTENMQRQNLDCSIKHVENETKTTESVCDVWKLVNSSARDRKPLTERSRSSLNVSDAFINLSVSGNRSKVVRNALCNPRDVVKTSKLADSIIEIQSSFSRETCSSLRNKILEEMSDCLPEEERKFPSEDATSDVLLQDQGNSRLHVRFNPTGTMQPKSVISQEKGESVVGRVRFADNELETVSKSERRRVQPLLGYDWIAGLLDAESSLSDRSEDFFSELRTFRRVNKEECVHSVSSWLPVAADFWTPSVEDNVTNHERTTDTHQCTFCYRINSRLFATPLDPQAACPVCKMPKEKHPHTENEPAFIRVSIPRATLLPAYRYKAHRRCSFDPSDSLGLPSHCLSGWSNISMGAGSEMSNLDLRSSMEIRPNTGTVPSAQPENQLDVSRSRASGCQRSDQLLDVSRLARYQFQHLASMRTKPNKSSYPFYLFSH